MLGVQSKTNKEPYLHEVKSHFEIASHPLKSAENYAHKAAKGTCPHFKYANALRKTLLSSEFKSVTKFVDALCKLGFENAAALLIIDAYACNPIKVESHHFLRLIREFPEIESFIKKVPTFDAALFKRDVLKVPQISAFAPFVAGGAIDLKKFSHHFDRNFPFAVDSILKLSEDERRALINEAGKHPYPNEKYQSSTKLDELHARFLEISRAQFPSKRYGYSHVSKRISASQNSLEVPGQKSIERRDLVAHQCFDTAVAARSFFSSQGIPTEVVSCRIGTSNHLIAMAWEISKKGEISGMLTVDASPFKINQSLGDFNQVTAYPLFSHATARTWKYELDQGIAWFACELPSKVPIIGLASARIVLKHPERAIRGYPEFFGIEGKAKTIPEYAIGIHLAGEIGPTSGWKVYSKSGNPEKLKCSDSVPEYLREELLEACRKPFSKYVKMLKRLDLLISV